MATNLYVTSTPISHPSSMQSKLHICSSISSNPRYLQRRIKVLEEELENERMKLFQSEEARAELEARLTGNSETPATALTTSLQQAECDRAERVAEWLRSKEESESRSMSRTREHHMHLLELRYDLRICSLCPRLINQSVSVFIETENQVN